MTLPRLRLDTLITSLPTVASKPLTALRTTELALGGIALILPLTQSARALSVTTFGVAALLVVAFWSNGTARTIVAAAIIANGAFLWRLNELATLAVLWVDALSLLAFLLVGGLGEAGMTRVPRHRWRAESVRFLWGAVSVTVVLIASRLSTVPPWLVVAAMAGGLGALLLARDARFPFTDSR